MNTSLNYPTQQLPQHVTRFADLLDDRLIAMARYWDNLPGSPNALQSKLNYVAVVQPETSLRSIRAAFGNGVGTLPIVLEDDLWAFAADIAPVTANRVTRGEWWGDMPQRGLAEVPFAAQVSSLAMRLLDASVLLASEHLGDNERSAARRSLADLSTLFDVDLTLPVATRIATCFARLEALLDSNGVFAPSVTTGEHDETIACLPGVRAIYDEIDSAIFAVESGDSLLEVDWETVRENFADNFGRIQFTTVSLLPYLARHNLAVAFSIDRFRLHWGQDLLQNISVSKEQLVRNAAQTVLRIYVEDLPHGYIHAANDDMLAMHIHDLQNDFLKIQFQYELLTMMCDIPKFSPPRLHIDRNLPREARITYLRKHLREWLALYECVMCEIRADETETAREQMAAVH